MAKPQANWGIYRLDLQAWRFHRCYLSDDCRDGQLAHRRVASGALSLSVVDHYSLEQYPEALTAAAK